MPAFFISHRCPQKGINIYKYYFHDCGHIPSRKRLCRFRKSWATYFFHLVPEKKYNLAGKGGKK